MNEANPKLNSTTAGIAYSTSVVVYILISLLISIIVTAAKIPTEADGFIYLSYLAAPVAICIACTFIMKFREQKFTEVAPVKCHIKYYVIALLMIFGLLFSLSKLNVLTLEFLQLLGYKPREESSYLPSLKGGLIIPALIVIAVLPAVFEEFLFRGIISRNASKSAGDIRAIFIVGFSFALFHGSPEQTVYQFITGCCFSFVAIRAGSILPSVLMHFLNNAIILILYACGATDSGGNLIISQTGDIILTIVASLAFVGAIVWLILDKTPLAKCQKGGVKAFFIYGSVGVIILAVMWILSFIGV